jgi:peptidyl-prolyl cis-trans isomerase-like protein 2
VHSSIINPTFVPDADAIADDTVRYKYVKKKGYVRLHTNKGDINLELYCDKVRTTGSPPALPSAAWTGD